MPRREKPELTFQQHIADYLVREHRYGVLEQSDITDTEHFIAEDQLWAFLADHLANKGVEYGYEQPLTIDGVTKYPDFTIEDMESGSTFYWEHCGILHVPRYRRRWEEKLAWYRNHGILPREEGSGANGTLIITRDEANGSFDSAKITNLSADVLGG